MEVYKRTRKEKIDDIYYEILNRYSYFRYLIERIIFRKHKQLKRNIELKNAHKGKRCFIIGNAPSINQQDLKLLKDDIVFMVNRAFLHPDYHIIKPKYHVIVDPKLKTGEWPITFLDEIAQKNPEVIFLLSADFYFVDKFQAYKKKYKIYWIDQSLTFTPYFSKRKIDLTKRTHSQMVVEQAITASIYMGFDRIYFTGVEGNGTIYILAGKDSHSYGTNKEDLNPNWLQISRSFYSGSRWLKAWYSLGQYCERSNILLRNLTIGGIMDMINRDNFNTVVNRDKQTLHKTNKR